MSAGAFEISKYESTLLGGAIMPVKLQQETIDMTIAGVANAPPADPVDLALFAQVSKGKREYGVGCRKVLIRFTDPADLPDGYKGDDLYVPVLTEAAAAAFIPGAIGTYLGSPIVVQSELPENKR